MKRCGILICVGERYKILKHPIRGSVGTGRRARLRILWWLHRVGSSPIFRRKKEIRNCFRRDSSGFFYCMGNCVPDAIKTSGGGALRAEENGCRRSVRQAHTFTAWEMTKRIGFCRLPSEKRGSGSGQQNRYTSVL